MIEKPITLQLGQLTIAGICWGNPRGKPMLALHGWLDNAASFIPLMPYLQQYNLVAIDLPGHGLSSYLPSSQIYHFIDATIYVDQIINALGWSQCALLGHSMGGGIATLYAGVQPKKVTELVIIEGLGPLSEDIYTAPEQVHEYLWKIDRISKSTPHDYPSFEEAVKARAQKGYLHENCARILAKRGVIETSEGFRWNHDRRLLLPSPLRLTEVQVLSFITAIKAPLCLITGTHGFKYDPEKFRERLAAVKFLSKHKLEGGHHVHMEQPEEVSKIIAASISHN